MQGWGVTDRSEDEARWSGLMARTQRGDGAAYEALLGELATVIEAYVRRRFGRPPMLEDLVQECLLALHRARGTYDPRRPFRPWMFTIVHHRVIDVLRRKEPPMVSLQAAPVVADDRDPLALLDGARILQGIGIDQREAIVLVKYAGYTSGEAAASLGITESALKARLRRGLKAITALLKREETGL